MKIKTSDLLSLVLLAAIAVATAWLYPSLPDAFPTHFSIDGQVNDTTAKPVGPWLVPVLAALQFVLVRFASKLLTGGWRERLDQSPLGALNVVVLSLLGLAQAALLSAGLHPGNGLSSTVIFFVLGAFLVVVAQFYPRLRRNPLVGCRTAFTLSSDENWARTHRFGGYAMTVAGIAMLVLAPVSRTACFALLIGCFVAQYVYSFIFARREGLRA